MSNSLKTVLAVGVVVLYLSAAIAFSGDELAAFKPYNEDSSDHPGRNGSAFSQCPAGQRNFSNLCSGNGTLQGQGDRQIVVYQVIALRPNSTDGRRPPRSVVCCEGVGFNLNGTQILRPIGCGARRFGGVVYWGNATGTPGIRCLAVPAAREVKWRYIPILLRSGKSDIDGQYYSDLD